MLCRIVTLMNGINNSTYNFYTVLCLVYCNPTITEQQINDNVKQQINTV